MGTIPRAQARISSTIQLLPEVGRTSTIPRGPARTLSTIHLLLEVGRTSTTPRELARTSSITHHYQRAMMTRKTTNQNSPADTVGYYNYGINSKTERICWEITLLNVAGTYLSPARTATHIHEAARGASGPPRLAFPNPQGDDKKRVSTGCMTGPFTTGLNGPNGQ